MANKLTLSLNKKNIISSVKADTYITGLIDKSQDTVANSALAYNEQAGDDQYHEVKLYRTLRASVAKFEANMAEFVDTSDPAAAISNNLSKENDTFEIELNVGSRFNKAFRNTLASLAEDYLINMMLYTWWQSVKPTLAKDYLEFAANAIVDVRKCLAKSAPQSTMANFDDVKGTVDGESDGQDRVVALINFSSSLQGFDINYNTLRTDFSSFNNATIHCTEANLKNWKMMDGEHEVLDIPSLPYTITPEDMYKMTKYASDPSTLHLTLKPERSISGVNVMYITIHIPS